MTVKKAKLNIKLRPFTGAKFLFIISMLDRNASNYFITNFLIWSETADEKRMRKAMVSKEDEHHIIEVRCLALHDDFNETDHKIHYESF